MPLLLPSHLPGQEAGNADIAVAASAARRVRARRDLVYQSDALRDDPAAVAAMRAASSALGLRTGRTAIAVPLEPRGQVGLGTSFHPRQAEALGLDVRKTLAALLPHPFRVIRLPAYWDRMEPTPGGFDTSELDWQLDQAERAGKEVILCLGPVKSIGYPGYFVPHAADPDERLPAHLQPQYWPSSGGAPGTRATPSPWPASWPTSPASTSTRATPSPASALERVPGPGSSRPCNAGDCFSGRIRRTAVRCHRGPGGTVGFGHRATQPGQPRLPQLPARAGHRELQQCLRWAGRGGGIDTYLLWGAEYWVMRDLQGDPRHLDAYARILRQRA